MLNIAAPEDSFIYLCTTENPLSSFFLNHLTWKTLFVSRGKVQADQQEN